MFWIIFDRFILTSWHNSTFIQFGSLVKCSDLDIIIDLLTIYNAFICKYLFFFFVSNASNTIIFGELKIGQNETSIELFWADPFFQIFFVFFLQTHTQIINRDIIIIISSFPINLFRYMVIALMSIIILLVLILYFFNSIFSIIKLFNVIFHIFLFFIFYNL